MGRIAALSAVVLLAASLANASKNGTFRIKVLDSETHSVSLGGNDVPKNCDQINFDAYCNNSKSAILTNTLLVQEDNEPPFRIACTIDTKFSRCTPLPKGESFDARKEKHGIIVYYQDDNGKARKQLYTLVSSDANAGTLVPAAAAPTQAAPRAVAPVHSAPPVVVANPALAPAASTSVPQVMPDRAASARCSFISTPPGAEIMLDGKYVGNTPSEIPISAGTHAVVFSMPGFTDWKRDLTALPESELTVSGILQKQP